MATSLSIRSISPGVPMCTDCSAIRPLRCSTVRSWGAGSWVVAMAYPRSMPVSIVRISR